MSATVEQLRAALRIVHAIAEAVREAGAAGIPSGEMYAVLLNVVDLQGYNGAIRTLTNAGLISVKGDLLKWIGPNFPEVGR